MRSKKSLLKVREAVTMGWELWLQFLFSDHMGLLKLGITFPTLNPKCMSFCKLSFVGNSIIFYKDSVICISHLHYITYLHNNPT